MSFLAKLSELFKPAEYCSFCRDRIKNPSNAWESAELGCAYCGHRSNVHRYCLERALDARNGTQRLIRCPHCGRQG